MGRKPDLAVSKKGVLKNGGKAVQASGNAEKKISFSKDAGAFLKQRLGKKVRDLRLGSGGGDADASTGDVAMADDDMEPAVACGSAHTMPQGIEALQAEAARRGNEFEQDVGDEIDDDFAGFTNPGREAENTRRRFYKELHKVLAASDVIVEVLDARDPASCRSEALEKEVVQAGKRLVLLLNKIDLVPKHAVEAWTKHLQRSFPTIAFKSAHGGAQRTIHAMTSAERAPEGLLRSTHAVVGADELMQLMKNYSRVSGAKSKGHVSVGIVGYPNTGKSSVINSMKRHSAVETGGRAGVTKIMQEVKLDSKVTLIDCPGVVFEGSSDDPDTVLRNVVRVENVGDPVGVVEALLKKAPREAVLQFYGLEADFPSVAEFLNHVAQVRGKLRRGSGLDIPSAARAVISDWTTGRFRYFALPPAESNAAAMARVEAETAEVVGAFAPALDIDALLAGGGAGPAVLGAPAQAGHGGPDDAAMDMSDAVATVSVDMAPRTR
mmetsp:Transcript_34956/g.96647  ORF Transcript_34956/g.96647 Transcript_34956/m.96647 type:complete len:494 (-) Transcript_34956:82-1563(-)